MGNRFTYTETTSLIRALLSSDLIREVTVYDNETGNKGVGPGHTLDEAKRTAEQDLRSKQGPFPSELERKSK